MDTFSDHDENLAMGHRGDLRAEDMTISGSPRVRFFGDRWEAPMFEGAVEVPVPVGARCLYCTEPVAADDSGILVVALLGTGGPTVSPVHIECHLRSVLGCLSHLQRRCSCYGGTAHEGTDRDSARAVMAWLVSGDAEGS